MRPRCAEYKKTDKSGWYFGYIMVTMKVMTTEQDWQGVQQNAKQEGENLHVCGKKFRLPTT